MEVQDPHRPSVLGEVAFLTGATLIRKRVGIYGGSYVDLLRYGIVHDTRWCLLQVAALRPRDGLGTHYKHPTLQIFV